jgi:ferredoxin
MRLTVDTERCIASGECVAALPEVFRQDDSEGYAETYREPSDTQYETVRRAAAGCPVQAIRLD